MEVVPSPPPPDARESGAPDVIAISRGGGAMAFLICTLFRARKVCAFSGARLGK